MPTSITPSAGPLSIPKATPIEDVLPKAELERKPLFRHIDFFDANKDGKLKVAEVAHGLERMGMGEMAAWFVAFGTVAVRGPSTTGHLKLEIDIDNAMKSEQAGASKIFQADGSVDPAKVEALIAAIDPTNKGAVTMADFQAWGVKQAEARVPGHGLMDYAKRGLMEGEVKLAWSGVFSAIGHDGPDKTKYLTHDDLRSFYDGSLFYRKAAEVEASKAEAK